jgi:hypothetical protein
LNRAERIGSSWYNIFLSLPLQPFDEDEIRALLAKMPSTFAMSDMEQSWVLQVTGGYPDLVQAALYILFQIHVENKPFDVKQATQELATLSEAMGWRS